MSASHMSRWPASAAAAFLLAAAPGGGGAEGWLVDVSAKLGLDFVHEQPRNRLFRQEGDGRFVEVIEASGLGDAGYGMGVALGDVDGDAEPDLYVTNHGPDALHRNRGDGSFQEVTGRAGLDSAAWGCSTLFCDLEPDGDL